MNILHCSYMINLLDDMHALSALHVYTISNCLPPLHSKHLVLDMPMSWMMVKFTIITCDWASFIGTRTETHFIGGYYI